jgi:hypothetical protein
LLAERPGRFQNATNIVKVIRSHHDDAVKGRSCNVMPLAPAKRGEVVDASNIGPGLAARCSIPDVPKDHIERDTVRKESLCVAELHRTIYLLAKRYGLRSAPRGVKAASPRAAVPRALPPQSKKKLPVLGDFILVADLFDWHPPFWSAAAERSGDAALVFRGAGPGGNGAI